VQRDSRLSIRGDGAPANLQVLTAPGDGVFRINLITELLSVQLASCTSPAELHGSTAEELFKAAEGTE
jgi:hypothetical protein